MLVSAVRACLSLSATSIVLCLILLPTDRAGLRTKLFQIIHRDSRWVFCIDQLDFDSIALRYHVLCLLTVCVVSATDYSLVDANRNPGFTITNMFALFLMPVSSPHSTCDRFDTLQ